MPELINIILAFGGTVCILMIWLLMFIGGALSVFREQGHESEKPRRSRTIYGIFVRIK